MKFSKIRDVKSPNRGTAEAAGIDFFVPNDIRSSFLEHGQSVLIPSGIKINLEKGKALIFKNKSGVASKRNLDVMACVVDSDYTGEIHINVINNGTESQVISPGEKLVQGIIFDVHMDDVIEVSIDDLYTDKKTERGEGGFGSTGTN